MEAVMMWCPCECKSSLHLAAKVVYEVQAAFKRGNYGLQSVQMKW